MNEGRAEEVNVIVINDGDRPHGVHWRVVRLRGPLHVGYLDALPRGPNRARVVNVEPNQAGPVISRTQDDGQSPRRIIYVWIRNWGDRGMFLSQGLRVRWSKARVWIYGDACVWRVAREPVGRNIRYPAFGVGDVLIAHGS